MESGKVGIISNINIVKRSPLFIPTMVYLLGILVGSRYYIDLKYLVKIVLLVIPIAFFILKRGYKKRGFLTDILLPAMLCLSLLLCGWINVNTSGFLKLKSEYSKIASMKSLEVNCKITGTILEKERSIQAEVTVVEHKEKMLLYIDRNIDAEAIKVGDTLLCCIQPKKIRNYPGSAFDYVRYMERRGFFCTSYVRANDLIIKKQEKPTLREKILRAKEWYVRCLTRENDCQESGILVSLTVGDKSHISSNIRESFSKAGSMHLMAVSGLHVSFIFTFVFVLLSFLGKGKKGIILKYSISSIFIWGYTALVGFSPSITRASIMATILGLSSITERNGSSLNSLSLSALIITLIKPQSLFDLGFQLSFSAILSIIFIYPYVRNMMVSGKSLFKYVWNIISISIACQIGTSLITISNFNTIPVYFLLTNIIAIPLAGIILYIALLHAVAMLVGFHADIIMRILLDLTEFLGWVMERVESLPFSTIKCSLSNLQAGFVLFIFFVIFFYLPGNCAKK